MKEKKINQKLATVFSILLLTVLVFGCTQQQAPPANTQPAPGSPENPMLDDEIGSIEKDIAELEDDLGEMNNLLEDSEETADIQLLDFDESLFE